MINSSLENHLCDFGDLSRSGLKGLTTDLSSVKSHPGQRLKVVSVSAPVERKLERRIVTGHSDKLLSVKVNNGPSVCDHSPDDKSNNMLS